MMNPAHDVLNVSGGHLFGPDVPVQAKQRRRNSGRGAHLFKKGKLESATREGPDIGPTVYQGRGNRSNEIPWTWHKGTTEGTGGVFSQ